MKHGKKSICLVSLASTSSDVCHHHVSMTKTLSTQTRTRCPDLVGDGLGGSESYEKVGTGFELI